MKLFTRPNSFFEATTSMIYLNYVLGLRVFEYPRGHPRSVLSFIYFLIIYVIFCGGISSMDQYFVDNTLLKLEYILFLITGYIYILTVILKMIFGWWHSKQITVCHKKILEIDKTLRQLGLTVNYDRIYFTTIGIITLWFLVIVMLTVVGLFYLKSRINILISIYIIFVTSLSLSIDYINVFEFYLFARCLHTKFELINHLLHETIRNSPAEETKLGTFELKDYTKLMDFEQQKTILSMKIISQWRQRLHSASNFVLRKQSPVTSQIEIHIPFRIKKDLLNKLRERSHENVSITKCENQLHLLQIMNSEFQIFQRQMHLELCKISRIICSAFGVQIAWELGVAIMFIIQTLYTYYNRYIVHLQIAPVEDTIIITIMCFIYIFKIFVLSRACKNAADEGNKTVELIHITYGCNTNFDTQEEMQQFGIQILHSPVIFCVFGLRLDNHMLSMILKTVTTYMVIMIQVSSSLESNSDIKNLQF